MKDLYTWIREKLRPDNAIMEYFERVRVEGTKIRSATSIRAVPQTCDQIAEAIKKKPADVFKALVRLERAGKVVVHQGGTWSLTYPAQQHPENPRFSPRW